MERSFSISKIKEPFDKLRANGFKQLRANGFKQLRANGIRQTQGNGWHSDRLTTN